MMRISQPCNRDFYKAYRKSGKRSIQDVKWIVLHDTEAASARGVASYFHSSNAQGSAHLVVDDNECYRCLANEDIPWGAPGANTNGFHIEQCGFAKWSTVIWKSHINTIRRAAYKAAVHAKLFNIPCVWVDAAGLQNGWKGVTTHREVSKAFGGDHTDPGPFYPKPMFMWFMRRYRKELDGYDAQTQ